MVLNKVKDKGVLRKATPEEQQKSEQGGKDYVTLLNKNTVAGQQNLASARQATATQIQQADPATIARQKLEQQAAEANVTQALLQQEIAKQNTAIKENQVSDYANTQKPVQDIQKAKDFLAEKAKPENQPLDNSPLATANRFLGNTPPLALGTYAANKLNLSPNSAAEAANQERAAGETIGLVARIYDTIKSSLSAGKSTGVKKAEAAFTDARFILSNDVNMVKAGQKDYIDAYNDFQLAEDSITSLEAEKKGLGKLNLRYWLDNGQEIEAQILREKANLAQLKIQLEAARQTAALNQAKARYGLPQDTSQNQNQQQQ
jgi:hypothetical protein